MLTDSYNYRIQCTERLWCICRFCDFINNRSNFLHMSHTIQVWDLFERNLQIG